QPGTLLRRSGWFCRTKPPERRLTMKMTMKQGALALALLGTAALFSGTAVGNSFDVEGDFGGGYRIIGPGGPERRAYLRHHVFRPYDEGRPVYYFGAPYSYGYGPAWDYEYYGPSVGFYGPGVGVGIY